MKHWTHSVFSDTVAVEWSLHTSISLRNFYTITVSRCRCRDDRSQSVVLTLFVLSSSIRTGKEEPYLSNPYHITLSTLTSSQLYTYLYTMIGSCNRKSKEQEAYRKHHSSPRITYKFMEKGYCCSNKHITALSKSVRVT